MKFEIEQIENGWLLRATGYGDFTIVIIACATLEEAAAEMVKRGTVKRFVADENEVLS